MARLLPARPSLKHLRNEAKALHKAHKDGDAKTCEVLRQLNRFGNATDAQILGADLPLEQVQFALAMDYGFKTWSAMKAFVEALPTMRSVGLPLSEHGSLSRWQVDNPQDFEVNGDTWVFNGNDVRLEVGGMSWDDYVLSGDVWVNRRSPGGKYCVQLTGRGTSIYCQLVPGCVQIAYYCGEPARAPKGFTPLARREAEVAERTWLRFEMEAKAGTITAFLNGEKVVSANIPCGTRGMLGLLVNQQRDAEVRIRNLRVKFLQPNAQQFGEYGTNALTNWQRYVDVHGDALPEEPPAEA